MTDLIINTYTKYIFDYSDGSNSVHPFIITVGTSITSNQLGTADTSNSRYILELTSVPAGIYVQCGNHSNMGSNYDSKITVIDKNSEILSVKGSIYYNSDSNLFMGYTNNGWNSLGGINPYTDTTITNNLIVNKNINCDGNIITSGILYSNQLIVPNNNQNLLTNVNSNLFVKRNINTNNDELKIILNNKENTLFINENNLSNLHLSTDIFQFYNVALNRVQIGNRINGLNDPAFNTFTKYYVLQEYIFHQKSTINGLEVYVSENVDNNQTVKLKIDIIKKSGLLKLQ